MIDNFNLDNLPAVSITKIEKLPAVAGIYFAIDSSDRLWYIGKAKNINQRWMNHHRYHQLEKINRKTPILLKWYECENDENILTQLENYFIEAYHPELNQTKVELKQTTPGEITLRKTLAKISKYVIYGYEENSKIFGLPTVIMKYDINNHNPARILRNIFDGDNRKGSLRWSYYSRRKSTPIWQTKCNGVGVVVGCDYNISYYMQNGESATLAGVTLLNLSAEDYQKNIVLKDWSQSYHTDIQRYVEDPIPLLWSKNTSFDELDAEAIKEFACERNKSRIGKGRERGRQVRVYCEAIGRGRYVIKAYQEAIEWFGGYEILGLQKTDLLSEQTDAAPKWFKTYKVTVRIPEPEEDSYRSLSAPISAVTHTELEQRLERIKQISPLHQKIKLKRQ